MKTLKKQQLEVLSIYKYVFCFLFMGPFFSFLASFLLFTSLWWLSVLYSVWLFLDQDIPHRGGRCCQWTRNWALWKHLSDYFPIKLIKTAELPSDGNYVPVTHPHGILAIASFCNFCTEGTGSSQQFPGLQFSVAILNRFFCLPVYRDYVMSYGVCSMNRQSLDFILSQPQLGQAVVIMVGGAHEALHAIPGQHCLILRNRKGFVRLALRHGPLLSCLLTFPAALENDIFSVKAFAPDSWQRPFQVTIKKSVDISPCIFWGCGLFSAKSWGLMPLARPITTVVGRPIPVPQCPQRTEEQVDHYHTLYMKALEQLFEEHKESCGLLASTHLTFF
ncbi:2-acylglycerol O-acyltransferase 3-like [Bubalus kerabau]|uniref:2-acylglycerol O-acyltransferase 3-like n=1 Tax=Bubalus carabanensis TaxID=3119969 RepID=UPI00244E913D|nr:2-acylglycerol O-acyltransferase 3-like [Bubalus carabanensis]